MPINRKMMELVTGLLSERLSPHLYYHNLDHTLYVAEKAVEIGANEGCPEEELELLEAAGLWHDTGFINTYVGHEEAGCLLMKEHLGAFGYSSDTMLRIAGMIMATKLPQSPGNKLECIVADADLEYLGTGEAASTAESLYRELAHIDPSLTQREWNRRQIAFLSKHRYFTSFCRENREPAKQVYLESLRKKRSK